MGRLGPNQALAFEVVERLWAAGVRTFCVCPGGRNAPLVQAIDRVPRATAQVISFFEERSAGFFAIGRARRDGAPVAVVTTSGTAAAELLPAMVEAYYSAAPLVAVTADRPVACRGTGAPQCIEQVGLFGCYAREVVDLDRPETLWAVSPELAPTHVNVCFDEPLLDGWTEDAHLRLGPLGDMPPATAGPSPELVQKPGGGADRPPPHGFGGLAGAFGAGGQACPGRAAASEVLKPPLADAPAASASRGRSDDIAAALQVGAFLEQVRSPLVVVGSLSSQADRDSVVTFCRGLGAPVIVEASAGVGPALAGCLLRSGDAAARLGFEQGLFDSVVRIGDVPSFRTWRDLDRSPHRPVLSVSRRPWRGLTHGTHVEVPASVPLPLPVPPRRDGLGPREGIDDLFARDRAIVESTDRLLERFPASEPALVRRLSASIPAGSFVYLGNSLPIREWNRFAAPEDRRFSIGESRGANGIDGQVSTFLGWARQDVENWAIVGDLTALYDLAALWPVRHLDGLRLRIVVINNGGGRIFQRMFGDERFQNRHGAGFEAWAALWGAEYHLGLPETDSMAPAETCSIGDEFSPGRCLGPTAVIELRPDERETEAFWECLDEETRG